MSLITALLYPLRGRNILSLLGLSFVYILVAMFLSRIDSIMSILNMSFAILMTAYYWLALKELLEGNTELPSVRLAFMYFHQGTLISIAQVVYAFLLFLFWTFLSVANNTLAIVAIFVFGAFIYLLLTVGIIRFASEEGWTSLYDVLGNFKLLTMYPLKALKLLFFEICLIAVGILLIYTGAYALISIFYTRALSQSGALSLFSIMFSFALIFTTLYGILVHTYLLYGFSLETNIQGRSEKTKIRSTQRAREFRAKKLPNHS